jgi:hypothetical protein
MSAQDQPVFFARRFTFHVRGMMWAIASPGQGFDNPAARLYNCSRRFWLKDDDGEMFGMHFYSLGGRRSAPRAFHFVLPNTVPYFPQTEQHELSRIAKAKASDSSAVRILSSKVPTMDPNGRTVLKFGKVFVVASVKNFVLEDEQERTLFMIYKFSDATCTVKVRAPLTPLMAFAMAIAIVNSNR